MPLRAPHGHQRAVKLTDGTARLRTSDVVQHRVVAAAELAAPVTCIPVNVYLMFQLYLRFEFHNCKYLRIAHVLAR